MSSKRPKSHQRKMAGNSCSDIVIATAPTYTNAGKRPEERTVNPSAYAYPGSNPATARSAPRRGTEQSDCTQVASSTPCPAPAHPKRMGAARARLPRQSTFPFIHRKVVAACGSGGPSFGTLRCCAGSRELSAARCPGRWLSSPTAAGHGNRSCLQPPVPRSA